MVSVISYGFLWGIWIVAAFLMNKTHLRSQLMFGILLFIIFAGFNVHYGSFKINLVWFILLFWGYSMYKNLSFFSSLTLMLANLTITLCYVLIRIYWLMDPAIFLIVEKWMFTVLLTALIMGIVKPFWLRISTAAIGICQGDLLLSIIFYPYDLMLGESDCISSFTLSLLIIFGWSGLSHLSQKAQATLNKQMNHRF